ncbi:MAG: DUF255 domain-containing protein [Bacteroidota bacterium]
MKKIILLSSLGLLVLALSLLSFSAEKSPKVNLNEIEWYTLEAALEANQKDGKKILIDVYTDWCGWCKVMDQKTFTNPEVIRYVNENFYAVKFDAEQRTPITYKGKKYEFLPGGRRGIHALAYELLDRNASYPSFVVLDENMNRLGIIKGYKKPKPFISALQQKGGLGYGVSE